MRLEGHDDPPIEAALRGIQRGLNLGRMVAIVIDDQDVAALVPLREDRLAKHRKPPLYATKGRQGVARDVQGHFELVRHSDGGQSVEDVMRSGHLNSKGPQPFASSKCVEARRNSLESAIGGSVVCLARNTVSHVAPVNQRQNLLHARVVDAKNAQPVERNGIGMKSERLLYRVVRPIVVEMLSVNVGYNRDRRRQL